MSSVGTPLRLSEGVDAEGRHYVDEGIDKDRPSWMGKSRSLSIAPFTGDDPSGVTNSGDDIDDGMYDPYESGVLAGDETRNKRRSMELKNVELAIPKTELVQHAAGTYTLFSIEVNISLRIWIVKRRFSDFHYLHQSLTKGMSSALLTDFPKLPPKRYFGSSTSSQFVEERRRALETYLQSLLLSPTAWKRSDLARFLDNENNNMIFIWNLERMNTMQTILKTMTIENKNETSTLKTELKNANEQVRFLQERIGRMEMLFLQHATGVASERMPMSILSSLSVGVEEHSATTPPRISSSSRQTRNYPYGGSNYPYGGSKPLDKVSKDDLTLLSTSPVSSTISSITNTSVANKSPTRPASAAGGSGPGQPNSPIGYSRTTTLNSSNGGLSRTNTFNSSSISHTNSMGTTFSDSNSSMTESSVLSDESCMVRDAEMDAALVSHLHAGRSMSMEQVQLVLDLTRGHTLRPASKEWRTKSTEELKMVAVSMHLQQALKLSCALLDEDVAGMTTEPSLGASKDNITAASLRQQLDNTIRDVTIENIRDITNTSHALILSHLPSTDLEYVYKETDAFIASRLVPSRESLESRHKVYQYLRGLISSTLPGSNVFPVGSFASNTFLPSGDVDVTAIVMPQSEFSDSWFVKVNEALCYSSNHTYHHFARSSSQRSGNYNSTDKVAVQHVSFVNAEIKLVKSLINGVHVDVSCNQVGALYSQALVEQLDDLVGQNHLLKRSILMLKQWCQVDAAAFCAAARSGGLLGAREGRLSTWSLVIMVLHIFRNSASVLKHPLQVLGFFLDCYSKFDWNKCALTISGAVSAVDLSPLDSPAAPNSSAEFLLSFDRITTELCSRHTAVRLAVHSRNAAGRATGLQAGVDGEFHRRGLCNVIDPTSPLNNAARSVDLQGFQTIVSVFQNAFTYYEAVISENSVVSSEGDVLHRLFPVTFSPTSYPPPNPAMPREAAAECDALRSQHSQVEISLRYSELVLGMVVHPEIVIRIIVQVLLVKGAMPIGEVGKQLQSFFGSDDIMRRVKDEFGGLKKLVESSGSSDISMLSDHPFNPTMTLSQSFSDAHRSASASAPNSYFFDHVRDFFALPFSTSGQGLPAPAKSGSRGKGGSSNGGKHSNKSSGSGTEFKRSNSNTGSQQSHDSGSGHSQSHLQQAVHFMQPVYDQPMGGGYFIQTPQAQGPVHHPSMYSMMQVAAMPMAIPGQELYLMPPQGMVYLQQPPLQGRENGGPE